jgi:hypothetical protein
MKKILSLLTIAFFSIFLFNSCATLNSLTGLTRAQFKLDKAVGYQLAGIDISNKHSLGDFGIGDGLNLLNAFRTGRFPLTFTLNVAVKNPNAHQPGSMLSSISLTAFPWRLLIDNKETISGGIGAAVALPDGGTTTIIPLFVSVDLKQFFADKGYEDIVALALAISGQGTAKLSLKAQPTITTPLGSIKYPNELTIVNTEFRN